MECTYSVFVLDDLVSGPGSAFGDGSTEWEPEISEPGDLVCPIVSSEYTSLEPIGNSGKFDNNIEFLLTSLYYATFSNPI